MYPFVRAANYFMHRHKFCTVCSLLVGCTFFLTYLYVNNNNNSLLLYSKSSFGIRRPINTLDDQFAQRPPQKSGSFFSSFFPAAYLFNLGRSSHAGGPGGGDPLASFAADPYNHYHQRLPQSAVVVGSRHTAPDREGRSPKGGAAGPGKSGIYFAPGMQPNLMIGNNGFNNFMKNSDGKIPPNKDLPNSVDLFHTTNDNSIPVQFPYEPQSKLGTKDVSHGPKKYKWKVLCWVLTNPGNIPTRTIYVKKTWGPRCDKTLYLSTYSDPTFPTIGLLDIYNQTKDSASAVANFKSSVHPKNSRKNRRARSKNLKITTTIKPAPSSSTSLSTAPKKLVESKQLNSEKATRAWTFIYENYHNDYDFFYKTDDDTYVIVENLREYLETKDPEQPEFYGHRFILRGKNITYMSGGSGFVLTRKALKLLVTYAFKKYPTCIPKGAGEDWKTARCLELAGAKPVDTRDHLGRERFLVFPPKSHLAGTYPAWYYKYDVDGSVKGLGCCAYYPISFHYIRGTELLMIDYFLYRMRVLGDENFSDNFIPGISKDIIDQPSSSTKNVTTLSPVLSVSKIRKRFTIEADNNKKITHKSKNDERDNDINRFLSSTAKFPVNWLKKPK